MKITTKLTLLISTFFICHETIDAQIINCNVVSGNTCNIISNSTFQVNRTYDPVTDFQDPFVSNVASWFPACGTANVYHPSSQINTPPPFVGTGYAGMGAGFDFDGENVEGIATATPLLREGQAYNFSFYKKIHTQWPSFNAPMDDFKIVLINCRDYRNLTPNLNTAPPLGNIPHQDIYCETTVQNNNWQQVIINFTPDSRNYNMILVYVEQDFIPNTNNFSYLLFSNPELQIPETYQPTVSYSNCIATVSSQYCGFAQARYTWKNPTGTIVQQGPTHPLTIDLTTNPAGTYTLDIDYPMMVTSNSACSTPYTVPQTIPVEISNCGCGSTNGLAVSNPRIIYYREDDTQASGHSVVPAVACEEAKLCYSADDEYLWFEGLSNQSQGNIWEARIIEIPGQTPIPSGWGIFNGYWGLSSAPWTPTGSFRTYSTNQNGYCHLGIPGSGTFRFEIKLTNTITQTSITYKFLHESPNLAIGGPYNNFTCSNSSPHIKTNSFPSKAGYSYNWTFTPTNPLPGLTILTPLNEAALQYDDSQFNYQSYPTAKAVQTVSNIYGCPTIQNEFPIGIMECYGRIAVSKSINRNSGHEEKNETKSLNIGIYPNPTSDFITVNLKESPSTIQIYSAEGRLLLSKNSLLSSMNKIDIRTLKSGSYLIKIMYKDGKTSTKRFIKN